MFNKWKNFDPNTKSFIKVIAFQTAMIIGMVVIIVVTKDKEN